MDQTTVALSMIRMRTKQQMNSEDLYMEIKDACKFWNLEFTMTPKQFIRLRMEN